VTGEKKGIPRLWCEVTKQGILPTGIAIAKEKAVEKLPILRIGFHHPANGRYFPATAKGEVKKALQPAFFCASDCFLW
jgi:hypothetical protein